jgi:hypothetical protein
MVGEGERTAAVHRVISARHGSPITGYTVKIGVPKHDPRLETTRWSELRMAAQQGREIVTRQRRPVPPECA